MLEGGYGNSLLVDLDTFRRALCTWRESLGGRSEKEGDAILKSVLD